MTEKEVEEFREKAKKEIDDFWFIVKSFLIAVGVSSFAGIIVWAMQN